jgi:glycerol-3-phosphate dehydrogenase
VNTKTSTDGPIYDLIVIGGGITGAGVARDAALRGLSCLLLEKGDFASGASSKSTRLIHGGLRYLANFELDLVAESLRERAVLRRQTPYLVRPMPILIPIYRDDPHGRAAISVGVRLYDLLTREKDIPHYSTANKDKTLGFEPRLNPEGLAGSALFYDHQILMPERLVIENAISAREAGAKLLTHVKATKIEETAGEIMVSAKDMLSERTSTFRGKVLLNAAGPWIDAVREAGEVDRHKIIYPTKGVHLVLPRLTDQSLFVTSRDGRMFFIIPLGAYSLIGTTDTKYDGDLDEVHADRNDIDYLLSESRRVLPGLQISREAILYTYAGIRPLAFSGPGESKISRKHRVIHEGKFGRIITIGGGKLTTYRKMAKDAVDAACWRLGVTARCTTDWKPLAGWLSAGYEHYVREEVPVISALFKVSPELVLHLINIYGSRAEHVLEFMDAGPAYGETISPESRDIYAQVAYSVAEEGARTLADIILRRMPLGMTASRGIAHAERIAEIAGRELKWTDDEKRFRVEEFRKVLEKDVECLKG